MPKMRYFFRKKL